MSCARFRLVRAAGASCLIGAGAVALHALWIPAKAVVAQHLLAAAWSRAAAGEPAPRPWPWADTWPLVRLEVPRLGLEQIVLAGASGSSLAFGPGHVDGTPAPGEPGNAVVAGHRDTSFRFLSRLAAGDRIVIERPDGTRVAYRVEWLGVVDAGDPRAFEEDGTTLTLATCWPFDAIVPGGRLRYLARARRTEPDLRRPAPPAA